jgi:hypothetical protein
MSEDSAAGAPREAPPDKQEAELAAEHEEFVRHAREVHAKLIDLTADKKLKTIEFDIDVEKASFGVSSGCRPHNWMFDFHQSRYHLQLTNGAVGLRTC